MPENAPTPEQMFALLRKVVERLKALESRLDGLEQSVREIRSGATSPPGRNEEEIRSERATRFVLEELVRTLKTLNNNYVRANCTDTSDPDFIFQTFDDDDDD